MSLFARTVDRIPPQALVVLSRSLQALSAPIVALLIMTSNSVSPEIDSGSSKLTYAISFCNMLFVGNLCAAFVVLASFGPRRIKKDLDALGSRIRIEIFIFAGLAAILSALR